MPIPTANIERLYRTLDSIGNHMPGSGYTRSAYSDDESQAIDFVREEALRAGMIPSFGNGYDPVGNLFMVLPGETDRRLQVGSHLDTVPRGGNFDGTAGVVAGLEAIRRLAQSRQRMTHSLELVVWRGEESAAYPPALKGSHAAFGTADPRMLEHVYQHVTLEEAIRSQGYDPSVIRDGRATLTPDMIDRIDGHIELHIEQARVLENSGNQIGIVQGIYGNDRFRYRYGGDDKNLAAAITQLDRAFRDLADRGVQTFGIVCPSDDLPDCALTKVSGYARVRAEYDESLLQSIQDRFDVSIDYRDGTYEIRGRFDHSGGTPMDQRSDANLAAAYLAHEATGDVHINGDEPSFTVDVRTRDDAERRRYLEVMNDIIGRHVSITHREPLGSAKAVTGLDVEPLLHAANGTRHMSLYSGAYHDAANVALAGIPTGLLFIPCRDGISHNPAEFAKYEDIAAGASVMAGALRNMDQRGMLLRAYG